MEEKTICTCCGCEIPEDEIYYIDGEPIFYKSNDNYVTYDNQRYYGVELEVDKGGKYDDYAENILDTCNYHNEHIYIKSDGSLDDGLEIVSHP